MGMTGTVAQWLSKLPDVTYGQRLINVFDPIAARQSTQMLVTAGLVVKAAGGTLSKIGASACYGTTKGNLFTIAASTDMPALSGTIAQNDYNVFCYFQDNAGTRTSAMGTGATAIAAVKFPPFPTNKCLIGFVLVINTNADYVGGTTAWNATGVTAVHISPVGPFDPSIKLR